MELQAQTFAFRREWLIDNWLVWKKLRGECRYKIRPSSLFGQKVASVKELRPLISRVKEQAP